MTDQSEMLETGTSHTSGELRELAAHPLGEARMIPLNQVKPYGKNPRKISDKSIEQVSKSIRQFGWQQPLVVDADMILIIGHVRWNAAKKMGEKEVPVIVETRLNDDQIRALRIADNRTRDYSQWDYPLLLSELEGLDVDFADVLDLADWQQIIAGFEESQEDALLDIDDDADAIISDQFKLVVTFDTREHAEQAAETVLGLQGAINVRYSGS